MYSSCLCRHIYNNFLFYVFSKILALVSYAKIREEIKFMYVCMYVKRMPYTLYNNQNSMDDFRDKYLKEYRVKSTNISILKKAK